MCSQASKTFTRFIGTLLAFYPFFQAAANDHTVNCPTVEQIKQGLFFNWLPLYQEGEELASEKDTQQFQTVITDFVEGQWSADYLESAHCFYKGNDPIFKHIVLAQDAWRPVTNDYWHWITFEKLAVCHSTNPLPCGFIK